MGPHRLDALWVPLEMGRTMALLEGEALQGEWTSLWGLCFHCGLELLREGASEALGYTVGFSAQLFPSVLGTAGDGWKWTSSCCNGILGSRRELQ